ncbi:hypothetical protein JCM15765_35930 [Paradesulfitobacterium aromaticivorans]
MTDRQNLNATVAFSRSPQGDMFFEAGAYAEALARLQLMVANSCLGALTGEVGSGKSTLIRRMVQMHMDWHVHSGDYPYPYPHFQH